MKRKGRRHQPKVGTPAERRYAQHQAEHDVAGNFGVGGKGGMSTTVLVLIFVLGIAGVAALALITLSFL